MRGQYAIQTHFSSQILEAGGAADELARSSRYALVKNNCAKNMLNMGTVNLHDNSSWAVSGLSTEVEACIGNVTVTCLVYGDDKLLCTKQIKRGE